MEEKTKNEVIVDMKLEEIHKDIKEIKVQTTKTNGRVTSLESWRWFLTGGFAIISMVVVPVLLYLIFQHIG